MFFFDHQLKFDVQFVGLLPPPPPPHVSFDLPIPFHSGYCCSLMKQTHFCEKEAR